MTIDHRMNSIIHAALRRDLDRAALVLDGDLADDDRTRAVGTHIVWLMDLLHHHHVTEDERLFPVMRRNNAGAGELLDAMSAEHDAIATAVDELADAGRAAEAEGAGAASRLRHAVTSLRLVLDPHLEHEERDLVPVLEDSISEQDFEAFEKANIDGLKPAALAFQGHWMLDNLDPSGAEVVKSKVPAVPRFVMLRFLGGPYRRRAEACWGGTPATAVRSVPLTV